VFCVSTASVNLNFELLFLLRSDQVLRKIMQNLTRTFLGENVTLYQKGNRWVCPVCGDPQLECEPYHEGGGASFSMCECCNFEYGFDDDPGASGSAVDGVLANFARWRTSVLVPKAKSDQAFKTKLTTNLKAIGVTLDPQLFK